MCEKDGAYKAGQIVRHINQAFGLTWPCVIECALAPHLLPVLLRHVWEDAMKRPFVGDLIHGWTPPNWPLQPDDWRAFWKGFYPTTRWSR